MARFRTREEMGQVYQKLYRLSERPHPPYPYVIQVKKNMQRLIFFGSEHANDPNHIQFSELKDHWDDFMRSTSKAKSIVFVEGMGWPVLKNAKKAIEQYSESGYIVHLADKAGRNYRSGEPDRKTEIEHLRKKFSREDIMIYYFVRMIPQLQRRQPKLEFNRFMQEDVLDRYQRLTGWNDSYFTLVGMKELIKKKTGITLRSNLTKSLRPLHWPRRSSVSNASGRYRDEYLFAQLKAYWDKGYSIFAVYGSGHAITLEPALKELAK